MDFSHGCDCLFIRLAEPNCVNAIKVGGLSFNSTRVLNGTCYMSSLGFIQIKPTYFHNGSTQLLSDLLYYDLPNWNLELFLPCADS
jgi:hypothetical protein